MWEETQTATARALEPSCSTRRRCGAHRTSRARSPSGTAQVRPEALLVLVDSLINMHHQHIVAFATQQHLPSMFTTREPVVAGALMSDGR